MLSFIYNLILLLIVPIAVPLGYIFAYRRGEDKDYFERIGFIKVNKEFTRSIWIHCASVGEVRSIKTVYSYLKEVFPDVSIVISTTTATGKKTAIEELKPDFAFLLPIENRWAISYLIDIFQCKLLLIVDTELWPNMIITASKKIPMILLNGRISDRSFKRYLFFKSIFAHLLAKFHKIFTKSSEDTVKFKAILKDEEKIYTMGNIKYLNFSKFVDLGVIPSNKRLFVAASTHDGEEEFLIDTFLETLDLDLFDQIVLAPRHLNRLDDVKNLCIKKGLKICTFSNYNPEADAVVVDKFGVLEYLYFLGIKIFVGGSLVNVGGHNIFEALQFRKVIAVGPYMHNFVEIFDLGLKHNIVKIIRTKEDLFEYFKTQYVDGSFDDFFDELHSSAKEKLRPLLEEIKGVFA